MTAPHVSLICGRAFDLEGKVVGTVGAGRIGQLVLQRLKVCMPQVPHLHVTRPGWFMFVAVQACMLQHHECWLHRLQLSAAIPASAALADLAAMFAEFMSAMHLVMLSVAFCRASTVKSFCTATMASCRQMSSKSSALNAAKWRSSLSASLLSHLSHSWC